MNDKRPSFIDNSKKINDADTSYKAWAFSLIGFGIAIFCWQFFSQPRNIQSETNTKATMQSNGFIEDSSKDYWTIRGTIGGFTAGTTGTLFSLAGFLLVYLSFKKQVDANKAQLVIFNNEKVEGRFFELLRLHKENVTELKFNKPILGLNAQKVLKSQTFIGREVFNAVIEQFQDAFLESSVLFNDISTEEIYTPLYLYRIRENQTFIEREIDEKHLAKIDLAYLCVFFGVGSSGRANILSLTSGKYKENFVSELLKYIALKPIESSKYFPQWKEIMGTDKAFLTLKAIVNRRNETDFTSPLLQKGWTQKGNITTPYHPNYPDNYFKYYGRHQYRLGHYFRHLFQTVSFVNEEEQISEKDQYGYVRFLRGQLSTNEQIFFFINSLSQLGRIWELEDKKTGLAVERWKQLITDYMLIKNIPNDNIMLNIKISDFYPEIDYESFLVPKKTSVEDVKIAVTHDRYMV